jgi:hypothetical protein
MWNQWNNLKIVKRINWKAVNFEKAIKIANYSMSLKKEKKGWQTGSSGTAPA